MNIVGTVLAILDLTRAIRGHCHDEMDEHEWITKYRKLVLELVDIVHTADFLTLDERHGLVSLGLYQLGIEARWSDPETMSEWMGDFNQLVVHPAFVKAKNSAV